MLKAPTETNTTANTLHQCLASWPALELAVLFGSLARSKGRPDSDLDLAVQMQTPISKEQKIALIDALAERFGRPIDIIDLRQVGQPLLSEIIREGIIVKDYPGAAGDLLFKSVMLEEDFGRYQRRILEGRRQQWLAQ